MAHDAPPMRPGGADSRKRLKVQVAVVRVRPVVRAKAMAAAAIQTASATDITMARISPAVANTAARPAIRNSPEISTAVWANTRGRMLVRDRASPIPAKTNGAGASGKMRANTPLLR
jgi:hypothetical protein